MTVTYAKVGPPFNFLGHMTETQRDSMLAWMKQKDSNFPQITLFHQIRAQQLRKSAGLLEYFYANRSADTLVPSFRKDTWDTQGSQGYFPYTIPPDQLPAVAVARMKEPYKEQLQADEEAVFWMNWLRTTIERQEDKAQEATEATTTVATNKNLLMSYFSDPAYERVLVTKANEGTYRTNALDTPTQWEITQQQHGSTTSLLASPPAE